jgi:xanthine dehydrogenase molybdopterin-binding subunit B
MTTSTEKVPNTSATAASSGSDLNGQAVRQACEIVRERMDRIAADLRSETGAEPSFADVARTCWVRQVSLSATGYYATPGIAYDASVGQGTPFFYYAYGVSLAEVEVCGLTGEHRLLRVDILHDVGDSLVPSIDVGQIEGAFVQGTGWLTGEQVLYGEDGRCITHGPSTYKIPSVGDVPLELNVSLRERSPQPSTIGGSKAVGEPPFMHGIAVLHAIRDAVAAFGPDRSRPVELGLPATCEAILRAVSAQQ